MWPVRRGGKNFSRASAGLRACCAVPGMQARGCCSHTSWLKLYSCSLSLSFAIAAEHLSPSLLFSCLFSSLSLSVVLCLASLFWSCVHPAFCKCVRDFVRALNYVSVSEQKSTPTYMCQNVSVCEHECMAEWCCCFIYDGMRLHLCVCDCRNPDRMRRGTAWVRAYTWCGGVYIHLNGYMYTWLRVCPIWMVSLACALTFSTSRYTRKHS